jgi:tocopherol O-methyltransferase
MDPATHYDDLDPLYRAVWGEHVHHGLWRTGRESRETAVQDLIHEIARKAQMRQGQDVCDVGCGYGATARLLAAEYGARVTGLTLSRKQYEHSLKTPATKDDTPTPHILLQDWLRNELPDQSFDQLLAIESSEHMADRQRFFDESFRVLRPGGTLSICAWLAGDDCSPWEQRYLLEPICTEGAMPSLPLQSEYVSCLKQAGFEVHETEDWSRQVKRTWTLVLARLAGHFATHPRDLSFLSFALHPSAVFIKSLIRIRAAYETGAMRYGYFRASRSKAETT